MAATSTGYNPLTGAGPGVKAVTATPYYDPNTGTNPLKTGVTYDPLQGQIRAVVTPPPGGGPSPTGQLEPTKGPTAAELAAAAASASEQAYWDQQATYARQAREAEQNQLIAITKNFFQQAGMEAFINGMEKYVRAGYSGDSMMVMLANDPDYKAAWDVRFAGNVARQQAGLSQLLPSDYIELEQGYKQLMIRWGAPTTLFDNNDDFNELIGKDVSVQEVNDRLAEAAQYINYEGNENVKSQLHDIYGMDENEMFAYVLDTKRTTDYLQSESRRNLNRANVGGAAITQGVSLSQQFRDEVARSYESQLTANSYADASNKFSTVAKESPLYQRLGALSGVEATSDELVREQFDLAGGTGVDFKKKSLAAQERSRFSGQSGLGASSLSAGRRAQ